MRAQWARGRGRGKSLRLARIAGSVGRDGILSCSAGSVGRSLCLREESVHSVRNFVIARRFLYDSEIWLDLRPDARPFGMMTLVGFIHCDFGFT